MSAVRYVADFTDDAVRVASALVYLNLLVGMDNSTWADEDTQPLAFAALNCLGLPFDLPANGRCKLRAYLEYLNKHTVFDDKNKFLRLRCRRSSILSIA